MIWEGADFVQKPLNPIKDGRNQFLKYESVFNFRIVSNSLYSISEDIHKFH